jgi:hypothetical protein
MSISEDVKSLNNLWITEVHAPEILPYQEELVLELKKILDTNQVHYSKELSFERYICVCIHLML